MRRPAKTSAQPKPSWLKVYNHLRQGTGFLLDAEGNGPEEGHDSALGQGVEWLRQWGMSRLAALLTM